MKRRNYLVLLCLFLPCFLFAGTYGIGVVVGSPTGLSGKYIMGRSSAMQLHVGWSFVGAVGFHAAGDYQFLFPGVIKNEEGRALETLVPYFGIGGRFRLKENEQQGETEFHVGLRIGGGIEWFINRFGVFLELYPVVDFVPKTDFDFEGGLGLRFFFKY